MDRRMRSVTNGLAQIAITVRAAGPAALWKKWWITVIGC
jgi:hypothetical protein